MTVDRQIERGAKPSQPAVAYNAVWSAALALAAAQDVTDGADVYQHMLAVDFQGPSGI